MRKIALLVLVILVAGAVGAYVWATRHPEIAAIAKPAPASIDRRLVEEGQKLAAFGNCDVCHTKQGGRPYAGGLGLPTPFGTIYTTNITPDVETGIGAWSEQAFIRAMKEGVDREGHYLYPAFPFDYFARTTEADLKAIYAYLMTRDAVSQKAPDNELSFPFNLRLLLAGWNFLFHDSAEFKPDPSKDKEWNRGAYLVEGLGHCGACHSPRNQFGAAAKKGDEAFGGGHVEGWYVPPLNASVPSPVPWTVKSLVNYLIDGWDGQHGIAAGPMMPVVNDLYDQKEDDVFAIAAYVMSLKGAARPQAEIDAATAEATAFATKMEWGHPENPPVPDSLKRGAAVFEAQCVSCHKAGGNPAPMAFTIVVNAPDAESLVRVTFQGIEPPRGTRGRNMPARALQISDDDMVALAAFVRARFSKQPAWTGVEEVVRKVRLDVR